MVLKTARERWRIKIGKIREAAIAVEIEIIMYQDEEKGVAVIARKEGIIVTINIPIQDMITVIDVIETIDEKIKEIKARADQREHERSPNLLHTQTTPRSNFNSSRFFANESTIKDYKST